MDAIVEVSISQHTFQLLIMTLNRLFNVFKLVSSGTVDILRKKPSELIQHNII